MQVAAVEREVQSSGAMASAEFGISHAHAAHIMGILRGTLYSRKPLALLREYGTNGWDEHRQCGKGTVPIEVTLPTTFQPTLKIRDFGRGMPEYDVLHKYTQYGESTKRGTNDAAGMLGIGCKAGFSYADQFTITSWHAGRKSIYVAVLDKSNKGRMDKILEVPCGDETGIEVQVAVRPRDIDEFHREALGLFRYFDPQPKINLTLPDLPQGMSKGFVLENNHQRDWIAVMGCIPYRLDLAQLQEALAEAGLSDALNKLSGGIYLPIGSVEFTASREELQYTDVTVQAVVTQLQALIQEYIDDALSALSATSTMSSWDRRLKATFMHRVLNFPVPAAHKEWLATTVPLYTREVKTPKSFTLVDASREGVSRINIAQGAHIVIANQPDKALKGWHLSNPLDVIAVPTRLLKNTPADPWDDICKEVEAELQEFCLSAKLDGVPISPISQRGYWYASYSHRSGSAPNAKHQNSTFTLKDRFSDCVPRSNAWTLADPPDGEHVFVIISEFIPRGCTLTSFHKDRALAESFGVSWPTIYGYKTTSKNPVSPSDIDQGVEYKTWLRTTLEELVTDQVKMDLRTLQWATVFDERYKQRSESLQGCDVVLSRLQDDLGADHTVTRFFDRQRAGTKEAHKRGWGHLENSKKLAQLVGYKSGRNGPDEWAKRLLTAYPMLDLGVAGDVHNFLAVFRTHLDALVLYIKDMDSLSVGSKETP